MNFKRCRVVSSTKRCAHGEPAHLRLPDLLCGSRARLFNLRLSRLKRGEVCVGLALGREHVGGQLGDEQRNEEWNEKSNNNNRK